VGNPEDIRKELKINDANNNFWHAFCGLISEGDVVTLAREGKTFYCLGSRRYEFRRSA